MITLYWFRCPTGHQQLIDPDQEDGSATIICDQCDFEGYVDEGVVVGVYTTVDEMSHLRG